MGNSLRIAPPSARILLRQLLVLLGIDHINSGAPHGDGFALRIESADVRCGVYAARHAAQNHQASIRQVARQLLRHPAAIRSGVPRANNREAGTIEQA